MSLFEQSTGTDLTFSQVAELLSETHGLVYLPETDELYEYDRENGVYCNGVEAELAARTESMNPHAKNQFVNEVLGKLKRRSRHVRIKDFDSKPELLNVSNGVLDLTTGALLEHTPADLFLNQLNVKFDPLASSRPFARFLASVLPEPIDRLRVIDHFAACLYRAPIKKSLMLVGETDSGKSTTLNLIRGFLGSDNVASVSLQEMTVDRFATSDLFGKLANVHADISDSELKDTSRFKTSTGADQIRAQRKNGRAFNFVPFAKQFYSANHIPATKDESDAFFNRFDLVEFPYRFVDDLSVYAGKDWAKAKDPDILARLLKPESMSGILNVLVARARQIIALKSLPSAASSTETRDLWLYHSDFVENFLKDHTRLEEGARVARAELFAAYCAYCRTHKITPQSKTRFNSKVEAKGAVRVSGKPEGHGSKTVEEWRGIRLVDGNREKMAESTEPRRSAISAKNFLLPSECGLADGPLADAGFVLSAWDWEANR
ncbi:MAG: hypothetical protein JRN06_02570 [Nitrososphaerota archaeon]|nr:hypothetical protein [Nitrososphaerota archaeon]MDG7023259.1 hypothetical protein [Nitrososphaerota archaeon]